MQVATCAGFVIGIDVSCRPNGVILPDLVSVTHSPELSRTVGVNVSERATLLLGYLRYSGTLPVHLSGCVGGVQWRGVCCQARLQCLVAQLPFHNLLLVGASFLHRRAGPLRSGQSAQHNVAPEWLVTQGSKLCTTGITERTPILCTVRGCALVGTVPDCTFL